MKCGTTPGEAAVMNTSSASTSLTAACRFSMSFSTASRSCQAMGPVHAGRLGVALPVCRAVYSGKSLASPGTAAAVLSPLRPVRPVFNVSGVTGLALLAVIDDRDPNLSLPLHYLRDRRADTHGKDVFIHRPLRLLAQHHVH